ncbi:MAG: hypothetical protein K0Q50_1929 [Vampirovibrio sp.]|nr:hypothetical protein [Vampirovibrio sp.]
MRAVANSGVYFSVFFSLSLTVGLTTLSMPVANAGPGDVNSINTGQDVQAGTYFNTPGSRTTFQNDSSLHLHAGDVVRGLESNINKVPTGNGGTLYFRAPLIRLDGNIDVSAVRNGSLYTGNGGKVFVDSTYLFQNGSIFANGANGGLVQFNVGGLTMGSNARIFAQGFGGNGGSVSINSTGTVDLQTGSIIDTSGKVLGTIDTNVINIEGSVVNNQGLIRANGQAASDLKADNGDSAVMAANPNLANNPVPGPITGGSGTGNTGVMQNALFAIPPSAEFRGGTIRLVATGKTNSTTDFINNANSALLSAADKNMINGRNSQLVAQNEGDIFNRGAIQADGALNKNGGTIIISAARNVVNTASIRANGASSIDNIFDENNNGSDGGSGGTVAITALGDINNGSLARSFSITTGSGRSLNLVANNHAGNGGNGGVLAFSYTGAMTNSGSLQANGGVGGAGAHTNALDFESGGTNPIAKATSVAGVGGNGGKGGLIVFSGNDNPAGGGSISANGGQGGRGGNAWADTQAFASGTGVPGAEASATRGGGGNGGAAGTIVTPNPLTVALGQNISAKAGGLGSTGTATERRILVQNGTITTNEKVTTASTPGSAVTGDNTPILATRRNEYIRNQDVAILFTQAGGFGNTRNTLTGRMSDALIRSLANPAGVSGDALADAFSSTNLVIGSSTPFLVLGADVVNANTDPKFFNLNTLTVSNNGNFSNGTLWTPGVHLVGEGFHDMELAVGGGHISWLANGNITNNQIVMTRGLWSGGSINLAATQDIINNTDFITISLNKALLSGFNVSGPLYESSHAGSLTLKAGRDITNNSNGKMATNLIFFDIHPPLNQNPPIDWPKFLNGAQIGATVNLLAERNFSNAGIIGADALTYRNGQAGADNPALTIGGFVIGRAKTGTFTNTGTITANGNAFFSPNESDGPRFNTNTFPATTSFNGTVDTP